MSYDIEKTYICPACGSEEVTATAEQMFMVNTGDHYCHSVKAHDYDAKSKCLSCDWRGQRSDLVEKGDCK